MNEPTARQLLELLFAHLTGASAVILDLPFRLLRRICPRLGVLWDLLFCTSAGFLIFVAVQWCGGRAPLRFLTAALLGAALCAWLLRSVQTVFRRIAARKETFGEDKACNNKRPRGNA